MATHTPYSYQQYQGDGVTRTYSVPFPYLKKEDVYVLVDGVQLVEGASGGYYWPNDHQILLKTATDKVVEVKRITPESLQIVQWRDGSYITQDDLNTSDLQWLYLLQEHHDFLVSVESRLVAIQIAEASETVKGIVRLATTAETTAGTSKALAVHPAGLRSEIEKVEAVIALMEGQVNSKAPLASPALTGTPTAPTAAQGTNSTQLATTSFVTTAVANGVVSSLPDGTETVKGIVRLATPTETAAGSSRTLATTPAAVVAETTKVANSLTTQLNTKAPLDSPSLTGTPTAPTAVQGTNNTQLATTAFVVSGLATRAALASPAFTGIPTAPTAAVGTNTSQLATTAFVEAALLNAGPGGTPTVPDATETGKGIVQLATAAETQTGTDSTKAVHPAGLKSALDLKASLASPAFSGAPTAPTAAQGTNTTQLATTRFVNDRTPAASETVVGLVELATAAESQAGTSTTVAVHPAGLQAAISQSLTSYAPLDSPALTGTPTAPTAAGGTDSTQVATTAFVTAALQSGASVPDASETVKGKVELATAAETTTGTSNVLAVHPAGLKVELDKKANLASPALSGTPTAPTAGPGTETTQLATTAFVGAAFKAGGVMTGKLGLPAGTSALPSLYNGSAPNYGLFFPSATQVAIAAAGVTQLTVSDTGTTFAGVVTFAATQTFPKIPQNAQSTAYTLQASDAGKHVSITTGGITVPASVFTVGDAITIYNNSASAQTIAGGSVTLQLAGTATTGSRTLAQRGLCTLLCVAANVFVVSGAGLS